MNASTSFEDTSFIADVDDDGGVVHQPITDYEFSDFSEDENNEDDDKKQKVESDSVIQTFPSIPYHPVPYASATATAPDPVQEQETPECDCGCDAKGNYAYADADAGPDYDSESEEKEKADDERYDDPDEFVEIEYFMPRMVISRQSGERDGVYKLQMDKIKAVVKRFQPYTFVDDDGREKGAYEEIKVGKVKYQYVCKNPYNEGAHVINLLHGTGLEIDNGRVNKNVLDCEDVIVTSVGPVTTVLM